MKIHARLRDVPGLLMWTEDDEQWDKIYRKNRPLLCPEPDCTVELVATTRLGTRYFAYKAGACDHWDIPKNERVHCEGGPVSEQYKWLQNRLVKIINSISEKGNLGYTAVPEDPHTRADVFVQGAPVGDYCLEIQLRSTDFDRRTEARAGKGARTLWLIPHDVNTPRAKDALFHHQGVRVLAVDHRTGEPVRPWEDPSDRDLSRRARLCVEGTVARRTKDSLITGRHSAWTFLSEVLSGDRIWRTGIDGRTWGIWTRKDDLAWLERCIGLTPIAGLNDNDPRVIAGRIVREGMAPALSWLEASGWHLEDAAPMKHRGHIHHDVIY